MRRLRLFALALALTACASSPEDPDTTEDEVTTRDGGKSTPSRDAGRDASKTSLSSGSSSGSTGGSSSSSGGKTDAGKTTAADAGGVSLPDFGDILGGLGGSSDASAPKPAGDGGAADKCENLVCFDVFDCALWHGDALDSGFTKCEGFVCKK